MDKNNIKITNIKTNKKTNTPLVCLTAYTTPMAMILDTHCDILLVGDSLGMVVYGMKNTLGVSMDMMINHAKAVMRASPTACIVVDMPYGSYEDSPDTAYNNAKRIIDETGCDAVKLEGGQDMFETICYITERNIHVMAHIGLQPQSVIKDGGYKVKGKTEQDILNLMEDAKAVEKAGAFSVVIEGTIENVSEEITNAINIPTIGIGASVACDGQILVTDDMIGLLSGHTPKFAKKYANLAKEIDIAVANYAKEVRSRSFPSKEYVYKNKSK